MNVKGSTIANTSQTLKAPTKPTAIAFAMALTVRATASFTKLLRRDRPERGLHGSEGKRKAGLRNMISKGIVRVDRIYHVLS